MEGYSNLASVYDELMDNVDYDLWSERIDQLIRTYSVPYSKDSTHILEFACGTGNLSFPLNKRGYRITGVDRSNEMLMVAEEKRVDFGSGISFIQHDMLSFPTNVTYDHVLCGCDGVNYLVNQKDLEGFFEKVYKLISDKGLFIFDISSRYKLEKILGNNTFGEDRDNISYLWENSLFEEESIVEMELTIFVKSDQDTYRKMKEYHVQKAHSVSELTSLLKNAGFSWVKVYDDIHDRPPVKTSERILFLVGKSR